MYRKRVSTDGTRRNKAREEKVRVISDGLVKVKVKEGHTPKERRQGAHLPFTGR